MIQDVPYATSSSWSEQDLEGRKPRNKNIQGFMLEGYVRSLLDYSEMSREATWRLETLCSFGTCDKPEMFSKKSWHIKKIIDHNIPSYALLISILLKPNKCRDKIHLPSSIRTLYFHILLGRTMLLGDICREKDIHYELYHYNHIVASTVDGIFEVHNPELFNHCLSIDHFDLDTLKLTEWMIDEVIGFELVPRHRRCELMKWVGENMQDILLYQLNAYGNLERWRKINQEELSQDSIKDLSLATAAFLAIFKKQEIAVRPDNRGAQYHVKFSTPKHRQVYNYRDGKISLQELNPQPHEVDEILTINKVISLTTAQQNYVGFTRVTFDPKRNLALLAWLITLAPTKKTYEIYLRTLHPGKMRDRSHWMDPKNWETERAAQRARFLVNEEFLARTFFQRLPAITGVRGNSTAGKSTAIGNAAGILSVDHINQRLKHLPSGNKAIVFQHQQYLEGDDFFALVREAVIRHRSCYTLDSRLLEASKVLEHIIEPAEKKRVPVHICDIERSSLLHFVLRMLTRETLGKEPFQELPIIIDGYKKSISHRKEVIKLVLERDCVLTYELCLDGEVIAEKKFDENNKPFLDIKPGAEEKFQSCIELPADADELFKKEASQVITVELLERAVQDKIIYEHQVPLLMEWLNHPAALALKRKSLGKGPKKGLGSDLTLLSFF